MERASGGIAHHCLAGVLPDVVVQVAESPGGGDPFVVVLAHQGRTVGTRPRGKAGILAPTDRVAGNKRKRIAGELHDSLWQWLVVIKNRALLLLQRRDSLGGWGGEQVGANFAEVSEAVREVKISYDLRPYRLDRLGLTKALQGMIETAANSSGIQFATEIDNVDAVLPGQTEINFYRIV